MNTYTHSASVRFVRALMEELPFPVKDLFIDGYNRENAGTERIDNANPFRPLFSLMTKLDEDCEEAKRLNRIFERKHHRATGTPPCVERRNVELDEEIKTVICDMRQLLRPEHQGVLGGPASRQFFHQRANEPDARRMCVCVHVVSFRLNPRHLAADTTNYRHNFNNSISKL